jgi:hypothetical protein
VEPAFKIEPSQPAGPSVITDALLEARGGMAFDVVFEPYKKPGTLPPLRISKKKRKDKKWRGISFFGKNSIKVAVLS